MKENILNFYKKHTYRLRHREANRICKACVSCTHICNYTYVYKHAQLDSYMNIGILQKGIPGPSRDCGNNPGHGKRYEIEHTHAGKQNETAIQS